MGIHAALILVLFGLRPPAGSADYVAHDTVPGVSMGAKVVKGDEVRKRLDVDLTRKGYVVVEVGVFPESGSAVGLSIDDFRLDSARALSAAAVDAQLRPKAPAVVVGGSATVGWESARDGARRSSGVYAGVTTEVGTVATAGRVDRTFDRLADAALPEGQTGVAVAGYLYFPRGGKKGPFELVYLGTGESVRLTLP